MKRSLFLGIPVLVALAAVAVLIAQTESAPERSSESDDPRRVLAAALERGDRELAERVLDAGGDPSWAIVEAARRDDLETLRWLFDRGADASGKQGARTLLRALRSEKPELAPLLRANGADLDATDPSGMTLLMTMAASTTREKRAYRTASALVDAGADVNLRSLAGRTALLLAVKADRLKIVRSLLAAGAEVDGRDRDGWTPLMLAARDGRLRSVVKLLEAGADPNARSTIGWTPLMWAAWHGHLAVAEKLLEAGADPNQSSYAGGTALVRAVQGGRRHVVWALVGAGACSDGEFAGVSATEWARLGGRLQMLPALERAATR